MQTPHHRKIELQSPADLSYLYANTLALSRQKLDLHFPPSANTNNDSSNPDPMKERVRELVDEFITQTFTSATPSISINGLESSFSSSSSSSSPTPNTTSNAFASLLTPTAATTNETIEYEPYDAQLASKLSSLYAQLESLTTTVAQLRREAPEKAARRGVGGGLLLGDVDEGEDEGEGLEGDGGEGWEIEVPGFDGMGEMEDVYEEAVRTLLRLQGEGKVGGSEEEEDEDEDSSGSGAGGGGGGMKGLATTVGKVERAGRAAEVVENM